MTAYLEVGAVLVSLLASLVGATKAWLAARTALARPPLAQPAPAASRWIRIQKSAEPSDELAAKHQVAAQPAPPAVPAAAAAPDSAAAMAALVFALVAMFLVFMLLVIAIVGLFYLVGIGKATASEMKEILPILVGTGGVGGLILMVLYWVKARPKEEG